MLCRYLPLCFVLAYFLASCGDTEGNSRGSRRDDGLSGAEECQTAEDFFSSTAQPHLNICRTCHVSGGVADTADGNRFMLSSAASEDFANLGTSWTKLGQNDPVSLLLVKGSGGESHTGGALWPVGGPAYEDMSEMLQLLAQPTDCAPPGGGGGGADAHPLLGSSHGGSPLYEFCKGKADSTTLPPDPRTLVQPGTNKGKAVYYNAFWVDCHKDPKAIGEKPQPSTCGELRKRVAAGAQLMKRPGYAVGSGALFSGEDPSTSLASGYGAATMPRRQFNRLWQAWGLKERPDNFEQLLAERYGSGFGTEPNPYPLPGEDPNKTNGGSGTLPVFFSQIQSANGQWTGDIGITCHGCHSGVTGTADDGPGLGVLYGGGSGLHDYNVFLRDGLEIGYIPSIVYFLNLSKNRGLSNASVINVAFLFQESYKKGYDGSTQGLLTSGSTAGMDTPAWWNLGHKTKKFVDGIFAADSTRVDLVFYTPFFGLLGQLGGGITDRAQDWMRQHSQDVNNWIETLKSPAYPYPVDTSLAEQGAVLFHSKNLWAEALQNKAPKPEGGNGSCAGCHGAYSPRFVNDPTYIDSPALEGIPSYVVPKEIIGTDPHRVDTNNPGLMKAGNRTFFGYSEVAGTENACGMQNVDRERPGYYAQPLHGIWATAPYFHNGSVPNLWEVLKPSDRKPVWERLSKPARADQQGKVVMGFDTDLDRAFDHDKVGWKYKVLSCSQDDGLKPGINCNAQNPESPTLLQNALSLAFSNIIGAWNLIGPVPKNIENIEARKIYNTNQYAQDNKGHDFTSVLTDAERRALVEYLKTL